MLQRKCLKYERMYVDGLIFIVDIVTVEINYFYKSCLQT